MGFPISGNLGRQPVHICQRLAVSGEYHRGSQLGIDEDQNETETGRVPNSSCRSDHPASRKITAGVKRPKSEGGAGNGGFGGKVGPACFHHIVDGSPHADSRTVCQDSSRVLGQSFEGPEDSGMSSGGTSGFTAWLNGLGAVGGCPEGDPVLGTSLAATCPEVQVHGEKVRCEGLERLGKFVYSRPLQSSGMPNESPEADQGSDKFMDVPGKRLHKWKDGQGASDAGLGKPHGRGMEIDDEQDPAEGEAGKMEKKFPWSTGDPGALLPEEREDYW